MFEQIELDTYSIYRYEVIHSGGGSYSPPGILKQRNPFLRYSNNLVDFGLKMLISPRVGFILRATSCVH